MATSSRQNTLFGVNDWKQIYQTFSNADFTSYDYETLRRSFINYLQLYYPETFNDYTESSEFIALLDIVAFMGQAVAFRSDLNTRENFIDTAERRDSVIKLANLVGYRPKRNITGQGWLKVQSVSTTEPITDINGFNLQNSIVLWNDPANINWQEQMNTILNASLINSEAIGRPGNSQTLLGIKTDEYSINLPLDTVPIVKFQSTINNINMNFELVSVTSRNSNDIYEIPPRPTSRFNFVYRNDNLGFASANTGFFFYFKQGTLFPVDFTYNQAIKNQVQDLSITGVNDTDTWLWQRDQANQLAIQWEYTDNLYGSSNAQDTDKRYFSISSRTNDQVSYVFGDGVFSAIPVGNFRAYVRAGNALQYTINPEDMSNISVSVPYVSRSGRVETLTYVLQLQLPVNTSQTRESLAAIKLNAPSRFYAQNRMVNGEDYTVVPYTLYSSIIKSSAINRTSVGVSRSLDLVDPTGSYSSTDSFGTDGALYQDTAQGSVLFTATTNSEISVFISNTLSSIIGSFPVQQYYTAYWPRYPGYYQGPSVDHTVYWNQSTVDGGQTTGYFYVKGVSQTGEDTNEPIPLGSFSSEYMRYITAGAAVKIVPPAGAYYFDRNNRIRTGLPNYGRGDKLYFWASVLEVQEDGYNSGQGNNPDNTGPVVMNVFIPTGARIDPYNYPLEPDNSFQGQLRLNYAIIPAFLNKLPVTLYSQISSRILLNNSFHLLYDNSLAIADLRWIINDAATAPENTLITFNSQGSGRYIVTYNNINYYFGSVEQTRFLFVSDQLAYDAKTGKVLRDYVAALATNTLPDSTQPLSQDQRMNIIGQTVTATGVPNDFEVNVSAPDANTDNIIDNPDFFSEVTGYDYTYGADNTSKNIFFRKGTQAQSNQLLSPLSIVSEFVTKQQIDASLNQYNAGTVFYASLPLIESDISSITQSRPAVLTTASIYNFSNGQSVTIQSVQGMTEVNNQTYFVKTTGSVTTDTDTVDLNSTRLALYLDADLTQPLDSRTFSAYTGSGTISSRSYQIVNAVAPAPVNGVVQPVSLTILGTHNYTDGTPVVIQNVNGMTQLNNSPWYAKLVRGLGDIVDYSRILLYRDAALALPVDGSSFNQFQSSPNSGVAIRNLNGAFYQSKRVSGNYTSLLETTDVSADYEVLTGRGDLQYQYRHNSAKTNRIDPGTTNIIDLYLVTQSYYTRYQNWINDSTGTVAEPLSPSLDELEQQYSQINDYKMISDSVVLNSVVFKPLFGDKARPEFRATIKVVKNLSTNVSDSDIKTAVVNAMNNYFDIANWNFGDTFYFSELSAYLHQNLGDIISSTVLVPDNPNSPFGTLYEVRSAPYEIFVNGAQATDIVVISALTPQELQF